MIRLREKTGKTDNLSRSLARDRSRKSQPRSQQQHGGVPMRPGTGCQRPFWVLGCRRGHLRRGQDHVGSRIRQVALGHRTCVLPKETIAYGPGDFLFETRDINHTVYNKTGAPMVHILFEILPAGRNGPSRIAVKHHSQPSTRARRRVGPTTLPRECGGCGPAPPPLTGRHCESRGADRCPMAPHFAACWCRLLGAVGSVAFCLAPGALGKFDLRSPLEVLVCGLGPTQ
jgi:hypothetical protein